MQPHLTTCIHGRKWLRKDGAAAWIAGIPCTRFTCAWLERPAPPTTAVAALLDEVAGAEMPLAPASRSGNR